MTNKEIYIQLLLDYNPSHLDIFKPNIKFTDTYLFIFLKDLLNENNQYESKIEYINIHQKSPFFNIKEISYEINSIDDFIYFIDKMATDRSNIKISNSVIEIIDYKISQDSRLHSDTKITLYYYITNKNNIDICKMQWIKKLVNYFNHEVKRATNN